MINHYLGKPAVSVALLAVYLLSAQVAIAEEKSVKESKPVAVCSFSGYDALYADIETLGKVSGNPDLAAGLESMLKFATRSHGLEGLNKSQPWGAAIYAGERKPSGYAFLPVDDLDKLLAVLEPFIGKAEQLDGGVMKVAGGPNDGEKEKGKGKKGPLFLKKHGDWAIVSQKAENLALAPENPGELLGDLPKSYDVAIRIAADEIPAECREKFIAKVQKDMQRDISRHDGESEAEQSLRKQIAEGVLGAIKGAGKDIEQVTLGWTLDNKNEQTYVDLIVTARAGSGMQKQLARWAAAKTRFAGFCPADAALSFNLSGKLNGGEVNILKEVFAVAQAKAEKDIERHGKSESRQKAAKAFVAELFEFMSGAVDAKQFDGAMSLLLAPDAATLLAGKHVPNAGKLEEIARQFADMVVADHPEIGQFITVEPNVEEYMSVKLHAMTVKIEPLDAKNREKMKALVGDDLELILGVGADSVYLAAGREPLVKLKKAIADSATQSDSEVPPLRMAVSLRSLAGVAAETAKSEEERAKAAALAKILAKAGNSDHMVLTVSGVENGLRLRLEVESGIVKAAGEMSTLLPADLINK